MTSVGEDLGRGAVRGQAGVWRDRASVVALGLVVLLILVGASGCGDDAPTGPKIEWRPGTPPPSAQAVAGSES